MFRVNNRNTSLNIFLCMKHGPKRSYFNFVCNLSQRHKGRRCTNQCACESLMQYGGFAVFERIKGRLYQILCHVQLGKEILNTVHNALLLRGRDWQYIHTSLCQFGAVDKVSQVVKVW